MGLPLLWVPSENLGVCHSTGYIHLWLSLTPQATYFPQEAQPHDLAVETHLRPLRVLGAAQVQG